MDRQFPAKRRAHNIEKWNPIAWAADFSLSLFQDKAKWSVGWSVANVSKGSCPRPRLNTPRHFQTSKGTNWNNFSINHTHPRHPQTPLTKFQKIQILTDFKIHAYDWRKKVVKYQLQPNILDFILASHTWIDSSKPKGGLIILKDGRALGEPRRRSYHYFRVRRNGLLAGRWQICQREVFCILSFQKKFSWFWVLFKRWPKSSKFIYLNFLVMFWKAPRNRRKILGMTKYYFCNS